jgi:hypothetical protein
VMIRARAAITMIAHSVTQIAKGTRRFRCICSVRSNVVEVSYTTPATVFATGGVAGLRRIK